MSLTVRLKNIGILKQAEFSLGRFNPHLWRK